MKIFTLLVLALLLAGQVFGNNWRPTDYQKWQDSTNARRHRAQFGGSIENYQKADNSWSAIENDWVTVDDTLHTNRKVALRTDVNNAGQATVSFTHEGQTYTVSQRLLKVIWINTATHNWTDIADVSWSTPSVDSNIVRWGNVVPGVDYGIEKSNGRVAHGIIFKPGFLDSAITLYDQREDSTDIALGNVIAYELIGVDNADSAIGNVDSRTLKNLGRYAFKLAKQTVHFPGSDTLAPVYVKQRWIKQNDKIYCVEYVPMRRIKQIHEAYPNAVIWHNANTTLTGATDTYDTYVHGYSRDYVAGGDVSVYVDNDAGGRKGLLNFNFSGVSGNIDTTYLVIEDVSVNTGEYYGLGPINTEWDEATCAYNFAKVDGVDTTFWYDGGDFSLVSGEDIDSCTGATWCDTSTVLDDVDPDTVWFASPDGDGLTEIVQEIVDGTAEGMWFGVINSDGRIISSDHATASRHPRLYVEYTVVEAGQIIIVN